MASFAVQLAASWELPFYKVKIRKMPCDPFLAVLAERELHSHPLTFTPAWGGDLAPPKDNRIGLTHPTKNQLHLCPTIIQLELGKLKE